MRIVVVAGPDWRYRYDVLDDRGDVLITSEPFDAKAPALKAAAAFRARMAAAEIEDRTGSSAAQDEVAHSAPGSPPPI